MANKTLDLLYANVKEAYSSIALSCLGRSEHNLVWLRPLYKPAVQWQPVITRTVQRWSQKADETLQGCFEMTDWDVLCNADGEDIDGLTDHIRDYVTVCHRRTLLRCGVASEPSMAMEQRLSRGWRETCMRPMS